MDTIKVNPPQNRLIGDMPKIGIRPAIDVGISVSRVGGSAQIKTMKKVAGTLKLDLAQFRELEAFSKFGSDIEPTTKAVLDKGFRNVEILKQMQYTPFPVEEQVAIIYVGTNNLLRSVPVDKVKEFESNFLLTLKKRHPQVLEKLRDKKGKLTKDLTDVLRDLAKELSVKYK
jgi:F-type H+-transporting ATPase subunit alpha